MRTLLFYFFVLWGSALTSQSALPDSLLINIAERLKAGQSLSYAIGIIDEEGPQYYSFGKKSVDGDPVDENTIYEIGSISKTFTAILLAKAVQEGKRGALVGYC